MNEIENKVIDLVAEIVTIDRSKITMQSKFKADLGMDSLDQVELVLRFEREFKVSVSDEVAMQMQTVEDVVSYITKQADMR